MKVHTQFVDVCLVAHIYIYCILLITAYSYYNLKQYHQLYCFLIYIYMVTNLILYMYVCLTLMNPHEGTLVNDYCNESDKPTHEYGVQLPSSKQHVCTK